jgi:hypothetical protein
MTNPLPREFDPRYRSTAGDLFTTFRRTLVDAFASGVSESFLTEIPRALGRNLDESTTELKASYPLILPRPGFEEYVGPMVYRKYSETEITSTPGRWKDGVSEDKRKHLAPGPSFLKDMNAPMMWADAALDTVEEKFCLVLNAATSGAHGFDNLPFFNALDATGTDQKKIHPKSSTSRRFSNHKTIALDVNNPIAFWELVETHFREVPKPGDRGFLKLEPVFSLSSSKAQKILRNVAEKKELRLKVGSTEAVVEENRWQGKFVPWWTPYLADDEMYVFAKGAQAGLPYIIHSLAGVEGMKGGEFMAAKDWRAMTGTYIQPLVTMLGPDSEHAEKEDQILVKACIDFAVTLMCPWSVLKVKVTYS